MKTRKHHREPVSAEGTCRIAGGAVWHTVLENLTSDGCRIADPQGGLAKGQRIHVTIGRGAPHRAEVCWWRKGEAGLAFVNPLPELLLTTLRESSAEQARKTGASSPARYC